MQTFLAPLARARQVAPDREALTCGTDRLTYAELWTRCRRLAGALDGLALAPGDRVAILAANCHRYVEVYAGVPSAGYVVVPLNTRHAEPELRYALADAGAKVLITDRDPAAFADLVPRVVAMPDEYERLLADAKERDLGLGVAEDTLAGLFYTGGTTGASKGVMLTHRNIIANALHWMGFGPQTRSDDVYLVIAPLFHAAGQNGVLPTIWTGGRQVVLPTFHPGQAVDLIEQEGVTIALGVPTMLAAMAEEQRARPRRTGTLRALVHGGSPIATAVLRRTAEAFPTAELVEVYGATELAPLATVLRHEQALIEVDRGRACGQAVPGVDLHVFDSEGNERATGEVGEVVVRGPNVMAGYWNKAEQTASVLRDGAYWTGDLGYLDDEGYLFLVDRSKDMIVTGAENVYSTEVEEVLYKHPAVLEAAVFGVPDERWGEAVHAVVVPRPEASDVDPQTLITFCRERIAGYKVPKAIDIQHEPLPKSGPGKVLKRTLRAPFWEGRETSVN